MPCDYASRHALPRRGYGEQERPSKYLDKTNIGAGNLDNEGRGRDNMKEGVGEGRQDGETPPLVSVRGAGRDHRGRGHERRRPGTTARGNQACI